MIGVIMHCNIDPDSYDFIVNVEPLIYMSN